MLCGAGVIISTVYGLTGFGLCFDIEPISGSAQISAEGRCIYARTPCIYVEEMRLAIFSILNKNTAISFGHFWESNRFDFLGVKEFFFSVASF